MLYSYVWFEIEKEIRIKQLQVYRFITLSLYVTYNDNTSTYFITILFKYWFLYVFTTLKCLQMHYEKYLHTRQSLITFFSFSFCSWHDFLFQFVLSYICLDINYTDLFDQGLIQNPNCILFEFCDRVNMVIDFPTIWISRWVYTRWNQQKA